MKSYRIVRIAGLHFRDPMVALYEDNPELHLQPYVLQQKALCETRYVYSDSFSRAMRVLGHDAYELVYDLEILQKTWAQEKGIKYNPDNWKYEIILAQIQEIKPEVIYFQGRPPVPHSILKNLKVKFPFIKLIVVFKGFPSFPDELEDADILFVGIPPMLEICKDAGLKANLLYHSFDEAILEKIGAKNSDLDNQKYDFTFIGSSGFGYALSHQSRYWALVELIRRTNLELWIHELEKQSRPRIAISARLRNNMRQCFKQFLRHFNSETLKKILSFNIVPKKVKQVTLEVLDQKMRMPVQNDYYLALDEMRLPKKPLRKMFPLRCRAPVFGIDSYRILRNSKITFNKHTDEAGDSVGNMRMFQATGVGTCLLTDTGRNMFELFEEDKELVTYSSIEECIEKVNYLLAHDDIRIQIAAAGQRRTLKDHTILNRCKEIDNILQKHL